MNYKFNTGYVEKIVLLVFTLSIIVSLVFAFFYQGSKKSTPDIVVTGQYMSSDKGYTPLLLAVNTVDKSVVDISKNFKDFKPRVISEARPFLIDNMYKMALTTFFNGQLIILDFRDALTNPVIEFEDTLNKNYAEKGRAVFPGDINGDGKDELVVGTRPSGILKYFQYTNGKWIGNLIDQFGLYSSIHDVLITDSDGDGKQEIFATESTVSSQGKGNSILKPPKVLRYQLDNGKWKKDVVWEPKNFKVIDYYHDYIHPRYMMTGNFDGESQREIVLGTKTAEFGLTGLLMLKWNGKEYSTINQVINDDIKLTGEVITSGDIDNDGKDEIIVPTITNDALIIFKWQDEKWVKSILTNDLYDGNPKNQQVVALSVLGTSSGGHKKILLITSHLYENDGDPIDPNDRTKFNFLIFNPAKNKWERTLFQTMSFPRILIWGASPMLQWNPTTQK